MNIKEVKKIEITGEELLNILKNGLGVSKDSTLKTSLRIPTNIKFTVETEVKTVNGQIARQREPAPPPNINAPVSGKVCGNCSYQYSVGDYLHCPMINKDVGPSNTCNNFEPKPKEDLK